jgi:hypothetical protein
MPDATFREVFDWLADRAGQRVYIEVGRSDPRNDVPADFAVLGVQATLGAVRTAQDRLQGRGVLRVLIADDERSGIEIDEGRMERAKIHGAGVKVWQDDIYVGVSGGSA